MAEPLYQSLHDLDRAARATTGKDLDGTISCKKMITPIAGLNTALGTFNGSNPGYLRTGLTGQWQLTQRGAASCARYWRDTGTRPAP